MCFSRPLGGIGDPPLWSRQEIPIGTPKEPASLQRQLIAAPWPRPSYLVCVVEIYPS